MLEVELLDISRADARADRLASLRIKAQGQVPLAFTLTYDPAMIEPRRSYAVTAKLILEGKAVFRSDTLHPVPTRGAGDTVEILMLRIGSRRRRAAGGSHGCRIPGMRPARRPDLGRRGHPQPRRDRQPADAVTLTAEGRAHGLGGCNNFTGGYALDRTRMSSGRSPPKKSCPADDSDLAAEPLRSLETDL